MYSSPRNRLPPRAWPFRRAMDGFSGSPLRPFWSTCKRSRKHGLTEVLCSLTGLFRERKSREKFGENNATGAFFWHFSPFFALKGSKTVEKSFFFPRNFLNLAGWRESKSCPATKSGNPTFLSRKALGLDRVTPTLQRNREKKPPGNEKKAEF